MSCAISSGVAQSCGFQAGGLSELYLANKADVTAVTRDGVTNVVTGFTLASTTQFHSFDFLKDTASFSQELQVNGGQKFYLQTLTFNLSQTSEIVDGSEDAAQTEAEAQELQALIDQIALGKFMAVAKTRSGRYYVLGLLNGLEASALTFGSGAAGADFAGSTITLVAEEIEGAPVADTAPPTTPAA